MRTLALCITATLSAGLSAFGDVITVDDDLMDLPTADFTSLQAAIDAAVTGDEIVVYPGTYGTPANGLNLRGLEITIRSLDPESDAIVASTIIAPNTNFNAVRANGGETLNTVIDGFTLFRGGTAVTVQNGAGLTVRRCVFDQTLGSNTLVFLLDTPGDVLLDRVRIVSPRTAGGGSPASTISILNSSGLIRIIDSSVVDSNARALFILNSSNIEIERCLFQENRTGTSGSGGAARVVDSTNVTFLDCEFVSNHARGQPGFAARSDGGALYLDSSGVVIDRCAFYANLARNSGTGDAGARGGAVVIVDPLDHGREVSVLNSVFVGNTAEARGSGDAAFGGALASALDAFVNIIGCSFVENQCVTDTSDASLVRGGAVYTLPNSPVEEVSIINNVFRRNFEVRVGNSVVNHVEGSFASPANNLTSGNPSFLRDPDNFNGTWGVEDDFGDLRLADGSPAINAGDNAQVISATDLDGDLRIRGGLVDQGAYESRFARYFVNGSRGSSGTGLSWNQAVKTLAELPIDGGEAEVRIAEGTYVVPANGFELGTGAWIRGGYNANNGNQNPANNPVVLTGDINGDDLPGGVNRADNATRVLVADSAMDVTIESVTIRGANASGAGGGVRFVDVIDAQIIDTIIEDNDAGSGAGVYAFDSDVLITDSIIRGNRGTSGAAGLRFQGASEGVFVGSEVTGNTTTDSGGGLSFRGGAMGFINDTLIADNHADGGIGGVKVRDSNTHVELFNTQLLRNTADAGVSAIRFANESSGIMDQTLVAENSASSGGTVRVRDNASLLLRQSTIVNNTTQSSSSAGLLQSESSTMDVINSIVHGNSSAAGSVQDAQLNGSGLTLDYSLVEGWDGSFAGTGSIDGDPVFVDAMNGDYRVDANSSAIDAGDTNTLVDVTDLDGNPRVLDDTGIVDTGIGGPPTIDIGAYEFQGTSGPVPCSDADLAVPFGQLNFFDLGEFLSRFNAQDPSVDFAAPFGVWNFFDLGEFLNLFNQGCP